VSPVREITKTHPTERIVVIAGSVQVESENGRFTLNKRDYVDVPDSGLVLSALSSGMPELAWIKGDWERTIRSEVFYASPGHPCDYHYHDGNEYWVIFRGNFTLDFAGRRIPVQPGTLMAGGMGLEHGVLDPEQALQAIVMATPLEGRKRDGHLDRDKHGVPEVGREIPDSEWKRLDDLAVGTVESREPVVR
jgi:mannose-6-phosphate isomerase-like protein (cupin superfamily)